MRGIEKIVNQILEEANVKKAEIEKDAREQADEIMAKAEADVKKLTEEMTKQAETKVKNYEDIAQLAIEQKKRTAVLKAKQDLIGELLAKAYERIINMSDEKYFAILEDMLAKSVLPEKGTMILNERDFKRIPEGFEKRVDEIAASKGGQLTLANETRKLDGGFVLVYGGIEENCTFKALFQSRKEELQDLVHRELFG